MQAIVKRKGGFPASLTYKNVGTMWSTASAVLTTQRILLNQEAKDKNENIQKNIDAHIKKIQATMKVNMKIMKGEGLKVVDLKNVLMYVLSAPESSIKPYIYAKKA